MKVKQLRYTAFLMVLCLLLSLGLPFSVLAEQTQETSNEMTAPTNTWDPENNSYRISTVSDLKSFRDAVNAGNTFLTKDESGQVTDQKIITVENDINIPENADVGSIETGKVFEGYLNGQGHKISGFSDNRCGLVDTLGENGFIVNLSMNVNLNLEVTPENNNADHSSKTYYTLKYGVFATSGAGRVLYCSSDGKISGRTVAGKNSAGDLKGSSLQIHGIVGTMGSLGRVTENISNCVSNIEVDVTGGGYDGKKAYVYLYGITTIYGNGGTYKNCIASGSLNVKTDENIGATAITSYLRGYGTKQAIDVAPNCFGGGLYIDGRENHLSKAEDIQGQSGTNKYIKTITDEQEIIKAVSYPEFDFDKVWTTNNDTTMPELRKDISSDVLPKPPFQKEEVKLNLTIKIPSKSIDSVDVSKGTSSISEQLKTKITEDQIDWEFVSPDGSDISKYIEQYNIVPTFKPRNNAKEFVISYAPYTSGSKASAGINADCSLNYAENPDYTFRIGQVSYVDKDNPSEKPHLKGNGKDGEAGVPTDAELDAKVNKAKQAIQICFDSFVKSNPDFNSMTKSSLIDASWYVQTMARASYPAPEGYFDAYYDAISSYVKSLEKTEDGFLKSPDVSAKNGVFTIGDYFKVASAVTAIGYDPRNVGGVNMVEPFYNYDKIMSDAQTDNWTAPFYALNGLNLFGLEYNFIPDNAQVNTIRTQLIEYLTPNGKWDQVDTGDDWESVGPDMAFMQLTPIGLYYSTNSQIKHDADELISHAQSDKQQNAFGGYYALGVFNPASLAQVMIGSTQTGMNIFTEPGFIKNGFSLIDTANLFFDFENNKIFGVQGDDYLDSLGVAQYQLPQAYENAQRVANRSDYPNASQSIYLMTDISASTIRVNDMICDLPEANTVTKDNLQDVKAKLAEIDIKYNELSDNQKKTVVTTKWDAVKTKVQELDVKIGDVDGNGTINAEDAGLVLQYVAKQASFNSDQMAAADTNHDGHITAEDAGMILQYVAKQITEFPAAQ